uniref:Solute carrier organic anion transporter family, member 2B1 n=1 Tax=Gasterosteus aculeatus aculeatus TaxID=481459 RepID=A0AAQ4RWM3_GASAC
MGAKDLSVNSDPAVSQPPARRRSPFHAVKFFVFCHSLLQLAQLLVSGYMKSSISTIERRYGFSSQKSGLLAAFNEVGNTVLIVFVSFFGSRVHRPRFIGGGALLACVASLLMALPHFVGEAYDYTGRVSTSGENSSGLCQSESPVTASSNQSCSRREGPAQLGAYPLLLLGQLLLGIAAVPIQPFGISFIDDYASRKNSPLYLGILLAVTSIGPAVGFITGSLMLRFYVDFDKLSGVSDVHSVSTASPQRLHVLLSPYTLLVHWLIRNISLQTNRDYTKDFLLVSTNRKLTKLANQTKM